MDDAAAKNKSVVPQTCAVCGESSQQVAIHYSRLLCNGCRAFFKRTVQGKMKLSDCKLRGECHVNIASRKDCKPCRYQACLRVGVDANKVQPVRDSSADSTARGNRDEEEDSSQALSSRLETAPPMFPDQPPPPHQATTSTKIHLYPPPPNFNHLTQTPYTPFVTSIRPPTVATTGFDATTSIRNNPNHYNHSNLLQTRLPTPSFPEISLMHPLSLGGYGTVPLLANLPPSSTSNSGRYTHPQNLELSSSLPGFNLYPYPGVKPFSRYDLTPGSNFPQPPAFSMSSQIQPHGNNTDNLLLFSPFQPSSVARETRENLLLPPPPPIYLSKNVPPLLIHNENRTNNYLDGNATSSAYLNRTNLTVSSVTPSVYSNGTAAPPFPRPDDKAILSAYYTNQEVPRDTQHGNNSVKSTRSSAFTIDNLLEPRSSRTHDFVSNNENLPIIPSTCGESSLIRNGLLDLNGAHQQTQLVNFAYCHPTNESNHNTKHGIDVHQVNHDNSHSFKMSPIYSGYDDSFGQSTAAVNIYAKMVPNSSTAAEPYGVPLKRFTSTPNPKQILSPGSPELNVVDCDTSSHINTNGDEDERTKPEGALSDTALNKDKIDPLDLPDETDSIESVDTKDNLVIDVVGLTEEGESQSSSDIDSEDSGMGSRSQDGLNNTAMPSVSFKMEHTNTQEQLISSGTSVSFKMEHTNTQEQLVSSETGVSFKMEHANTQEQLISSDTTSSELQNISNNKLCKEVSATLRPNTTSVQKDVEGAGKFSSPRKRRRSLTDENQPPSCKRVKCLSSSPGKRQSPSSSPSKKLQSEDELGHKTETLFSPTSRVCLAEITDSENSVNNMENESRLIFSTESEKCQSSEKLSPQLDASSYPHSSGNLKTNHEDIETQQSLQNISPVPDTLEANLEEEDKGDNQDNCGVEIQSKKSDVPVKWENVHAFLDSMVEQIRHARTDEEVEKLKNEMKGYFGVD